MSCLGPPFQLSPAYFPLESCRSCREISGGPIRLVLEWNERVPLFFLRPIPQGRSCDRASLAMAAVSRPRLGPHHPICRLGLGRGADGWGVVAACFRPSAPAPRLFPPSPFASFMGPAGGLSCPLRLPRTFHFPSLCCSPLPATCFMRRQRRKEGGRGAIYLCHASEDVACFLSLFSFRAIAPIICFPSPSQAL